ncbi:hypothetical protein [Sporomusa sphaeroides]|uniref:sulfotransferase-like domain-containing protein n=1 Tax=Sporomusa sphaeroides TaxID=47679 RepID=UPI0031593CD4
MIDNKIIVLWSVPRSCSTVFERIFLERSDFCIKHEPFSVTYYYSRERCHNRYYNVKATEGYSYKNIVQDILNCKKTQSVFIKDMAYHALPYIEDKVLNQFENTFIIRNPKHAIPSLYRRLPDFDFDETGYKQQFELYNRIVNLGREKPIIIHSDDLCNNPEKTYAVYCERIGINYDKKHLSWEIKDIPQWELWKEWHVDALNSTNIHNNISNNSEQGSDKERITAKLCDPYYQYLYERKLNIE